VVAARVVLIGGTSNVGKSTVAGELAAMLGFEHRSTDGLARHPGRPWRTGDAAIPPHVVRYYSTMPRAALLQDVLGHYARLRSAIHSLVATRVADERLPGLVLEGSALWPAGVASLVSERVCAVWLYADGDLLERRMHESSGYDRLDPDEQSLVDRFLERSLDYQDAMVQEVRELGLTLLDTTGSSPRETARRISDLAR
jgi:2-phosphoglycerate kinase